MTFGEFVNQWLALRTGPLIRRRADLTDDLVQEISNDLRGAIRNVYPYGHSVSVNMTALERGRIHFDVAHVSGYPDVNEELAADELMALREPEPALASQQSLTEAEARRQVSIMARDRVSEALRPIQDTLRSLAQLPRIENGPEIAISHEFMIAMPGHLAEGQQLTVMGADEVRVTFARMAGDCMRIYRDGVAFDASASARGVVIQDGCMRIDGEPVTPADPALAALGF